MSAILRYRLARLLAQPGRALLVAGGIAAAAAMVGASVTVGYGIATGFARAATAADLPDVVARFSQQPRALVARRAEALPNVAAISYRLEQSGVELELPDHFNGHAKLEGVLPGRRGYTIVAGRDLSGAPGEALVEPGLIRTWHLHLGSVLVTGYPASTSLRIVGVALAPDTVAFPLIRGPKVYVSYAEERALGLADASEPVDVLELWLRDPRRLDLTLTQARAASYGLSGLQFVTRAGTRALINRAGGIVLALLGGLTLVALVAAGALLAASASAEVQRRSSAIGVIRALGGKPSAIVSAHAVEAALAALPPVSLGIALGWLATAGPTGRLLGALNELPPGADLLGLLVAAGAVAVALVAAAAAWPAWRAARRPPVEALRGLDLTPPPRPLRLPGGAGGLGLRLVLARPLRSGTTACVLGISAAVVLLLLALAALVGRLVSQPQVLGKHYELTAAASAAAAGPIARLPGVAATTPHYEVGAADSFALGETFDVVAFGGDPSAWEAPQLTAGRRVVGSGEAEIGLGLAQALGLHPGALLAVQLPTGREARFRVVGIVEALENQGLIAFVRSKRLLAADPDLPPTIAIRLDPGGSEQRVRTELAAAGYSASSVSGVTGEGSSDFAARNSGFASLLSALLRSVAALDGLVCLYALAQILTLTAEERRRAVAVVRSLGGSRRQVRTIFTASALAVAGLAAPLAIALERLGFAPVVTRLAASYVTLALGAGWREIGAVLTGLALAAVGAAALVARRASARSIVAGLRDD